MRRQLVFPAPTSMPTEFSEYFTLEGVLEKVRFQGAETAFVWTSFLNTTNQTTSLF